MLNIKYLIYILIVFNLASCKTSPSAEEDQESTILIPVASAVATVNETASEPQAAVTSSADTNTNTSSIDASAYRVQSGEFNLYPRETNGWDESGWSIITPSEDTRLIYVSSSSGDDATGEFYAPRDVTSVESPGLIKPYKTIEAAMLNARHNAPDWILLRRGDSWEVDGPIQLRGGRSILERSVFTSYGENPQRPTITNSAHKDILRIWEEKRFVAIVGISFYGLQRDPSSPDFVGWGAVKELRGIFIYGPDKTRMGSILIEDNRFNFLSKAISVAGEAEHVDIVVRRNVIRNSYNELGHAQGMSAANTSALIEENIFDHNGWVNQQRTKGENHKDEGQATMFNHNTYFEKSMDTTFRNNIFLRPSSMHNKWTANPPENIDEIMSRNLTMENNLYVGGEIGISAGGNDDYNTGARWKNITIKNNVMLAIGRDQPTGRRLGWSIDAIDWDGGLICGNYLLHTDNVEVTNLIGINLSGHSNDVTIIANTINGLITPSPSARVGAITVDSSPKTDILVAENNIQLVDSNMRIFVSNQSAMVTFRDNRYFSSLSADEWFSSEEVLYSFESWLLVSDDTNSVAIQDSFVEPRRTFETYLNTAGSQSIDTFVDSAYSQPIRTWATDYSADVINDYIRNGYGNTVCQ
jgi:hypothetical protein